MAELPEWVYCLTNLTSLYALNCQLTQLSDSVGALANLRRLNLDNNQLTRLPDTIEDLSGLEVLVLSHNGLTELPDSIGNLTKLYNLDLSRNRLTRLPSRLANVLTGLTNLDFSGNPLADPLPELLARGISELADYLRSLDGAVPHYEAKLLLVGEGNVGKSSLVAALNDDPFVEGRSTTHGIEISDIPLPHPELGVPMTLRAWDFGGQEVYRVSHQFFFSRRALYLVVWHSRQGAEQDEVEDWLRRIKLRVGKKAIALVVATHCNERLPDLDYTHLERVVPGMLAGHYEIDSSDRTGIAGLRAAIANQAARLPQMGQLISPRWTAAREAVLALAAAEPQIEFDHFTAICQSAGLAGSEIGTLAKLMHDLGLIIYYDEDDGLKDVVVLNPEWLTKAISYVLDDRATADAGGVLDHKRLKTIWEARDGGYPAKYHPYFLRLMEKFDISYRLDDDASHSLVPQLVGHARPTLRWDHGSPVPAGIRTLALTCKLAEPALGLIPWLTARHHRASTDTHWRRGVLLRHPIDAYRSEALVELVRDDELVLQVRAPSPDLYFNVLRDSIEDLITSRWRGLAYELLVPCSGVKADGMPCDGQFPLAGLIGTRENGLATVPCMWCYQQYEISALLTGFPVPDQSVAVAVEDMHRQVSDLTSSVGELRVSVGGIETSVDAVAGQAADIADTVRRVNRTVSTEVIDCPRLFSLGRRQRSLIDRLRFHQEHYQLTVWCEHPGSEHAWEQATYDLDPAKEWFTEIAPYARLVFRTLQLIVPIAAAIDVAALPAPRRNDAQVRLDVMKSIVDALPADWSELELAGGFKLIDPAVEPGRLTKAEGRALRAVRQTLFACDPGRAFGDMRRVQSPAGDLLWVCQTHYPEYDPGLPALL